MKQFNEESLKEELKNTQFVVLDIYADWCQPCKTLAPIMEKVSNNIDDVSIGKLNIDNNADVANEYQIRSVPTLLFFNNGECVERHSGMLSEQQLLNKISMLKNKN